MGDPIHRYVSCVEYICCVAQEWPGNPSVTSFSVPIGDGLDINLSSRVPYVKYMNALSFNRHRLSHSSGVNSSTQQRFRSATSTVTRYSRLPQNYAPNGSDRNFVRSLIHNV